MSLYLKKCSADDTDVLRKLAIETFYETFGAVNTPEDMKKYLNEAFDRKKVSDELKDENSTFMIVYNDEVPAGYMKVNEAPSQSDINDANSMEIERIYVLDKFQNMGMGKYLMEKAVSIAYERKKQYIWLGVWEKNKKALGFYGKNGFYKTGAHSFILGQDEQTDYIMRKDLQ